MRDGPSQTALAAAFHRADHQRLEDGLLFKDPVSVQIVDGLERDASLLDGTQNSQGLRLFVAGRSRFAEDCLAAAVKERRVRQVLVLGAGLDTLALRQQYSDIPIFEVDHPATQEWKRSVLETAHIPLPANLRLVPVDFECDDLFQNLLAAGFALDVPTFTVLLGVVSYLSKLSFLQTLHALKGLSHCEIALDYSEPPADLPESSRTVHEVLATRTAAVGEPHISCFTPAEMRGALAQSRFKTCEDLDVYELLVRYLGREAMGFSDASLPRGGAHVIHGRQSESD